MAWEAAEAAQIARIETKLDALTDVERRVDNLEQFRSYVKGGFKAAVLLAGLVLTVLLAGCTATSVYRVTKDGTVFKAKHVVIGKGVTAADITDKKLKIRTAGTGISKEFVELGGKVAEGAVKGAKGGL